MRSFDERFFSKVYMTSLCWDWTGAKTGAGYGAIGSGGRMLLAHRVAYERLVGPIPDGLQLDHLCRNRACVRTEHLEPVTQSENMRRGSFATRTHCPQGHAYDATNTYLYHGQKLCRACRRVRTRTYMRNRHKARA